MTEFRACACPIGIELKTPRLGEFDFAIMAAIVRAPAKLKSAGSPPVTTRDHGWDGRSPVES